MSVITNLLQAKLDSSGLDWVRIQKLQISPSTKTASADLLLEGETGPVHLELSYQFTPDNQVRVLNPRASRRWMTEVLELVLANSGNTFPLPDGLKGKAIRFLL